MAMRLPLAALCLVALSVPGYAQSSSAPSSDDDQGTSSDVDTGQPAAAAGPPVSSAEAFKLFVSTCTDIAGGDPKAFDRANDAGWVPNETPDPGPYSTIYSGSREVGGYGEVDIWASVQSFPTQWLGYCRIDFSDADNALDFTQMNGAGGLSGTAQQTADGNAYGSWESADKKWLVIGDRSEGAVEIEFNLLLGTKPGQ
jgi:hypothetical protein